MFGITTEGKLVDLNAPGFNYRRPSYVAVVALSYADLDNIPRQFRGVFFDGLGHTDCPDKHPKNLDALHIGLQELHEFLKNSAPARPRKPLTIPPQVAKQPVRVVEKKLRHRLKKAILAFLE